MARFELLALSPSPEAFTAAAESAAAAMFIVPPEPSSNRFTAVRPARLATALTTRAAPLAAQLAADPYAIALDGMNAVAVLMTPAAVLRMLPAVNNGMCN